MEMDKNVARELVVGACRKVFARLMKVPDNEWGVDSLRCAIRSEVEKVQPGRPVTVEQRDRQFIISALGVEVGWDMIGQGFFVPLEVCLADIKSQTVSGVNDVCDHSVASKSEIRVCSCGARVMRCVWCARVDLPPDEVKEPGVICEECVRLVLGPPTS